ncbi:MAG: hypothetical protein AUH39_02150 [Chloroflexi bacterium 13_1_40CM_67_9]|nr:MAG: hypothetical protein AUH39_02150 [Chloroflexi bacterium 13_1_40CM_67_9]
MARRAASVASARSAAPDELAMMPPKPTSIADRKRAASALRRRIPKIPTPVRVPPRRIAARRERPRVKIAAGIAPHTTPSASAPARSPIAKSSNPSDR